jgi:two-component system, LytTR family, sensor kinase
MPFLRAAYGEFSFAYLCAAFTPAVLWVGARFRVSRPHLWRNLLVQVVAAIAFISVVRLAWDLVYMPPKPFYAGGVTIRKAIYAISGAYESTLSAYLLILLAGYGREYQKRYREESVRAARLRTEMVQAQLQSLKMQMQPHFLFNTLHTISALVQESPPKAETTIARLSDLLRLTLEMGRNSEIRIEDELRIVALYLEIECTRYEERLNVVYEIDDDVKSAVVPSFILQPLIENAIRHGIANSASPGRVVITAQRRDAQLFLSVRNTGPSLSRNTFREGIGLAATRSRLEFLYEDRHHFGLQNLTSGEVEASIVLPFSIDGSQRGDHDEHPDADRRRREAGAGTVAAVVNPGG